MRPFHPFAACAVILLSVGIDQALAEVLVTVDKATQRMAVSVDGEERHTWPVSTGLPRYATPKGSYTPFRLEEDHYSKEWDDAPMPHSIFFTSRGHAIHGSDATQRLGSPASHGCIRLSREDAATLFDLVKEQGLENTKVVVSGEEATVTAKKKDRVRVADRKQKTTRVAARRVSRGSEWAGWGNGWFVQPQYQRRQAFWSPYGVRGQGYRGW
jgi:hypothetical protein